MNAVEFVKKYGLDKAKREISYEGTMMQCNNMDGIIDDLKEIVDAFELVEKSGGLKACRKTLKIMDDMNADKNGLIYKPFSEAVNLVEQCNA